MIMITEEMIEIGKKRVEILEGKNSTKITIKEWWEMTYQIYMVENFKKILKTILVNKKKFIEMIEHTMKVFKKDTKKIIMIMIKEDNDMIQENSTRAIMVILIDMENMRIRNQIQGIIKTEECLFLNRI